MSVLELLRSASRRHVATVLCSLQQVELAIEFADRIVGMKQGRIVFDGVPDDLDEAAGDQIYAGGEPIDPAGRLDVRRD